MNLAKLLLCIGLMTQCTLAFFSQEPSKTTQAGAQTTSARAPIDVYEILDYARRLSDDARGLDSKEDEIKLLLTLADSVWIMDQVLGKRLLLRSFDLVTASLPDRVGVINRAPRPGDSNLLFNEIRSIAARHDPKLEAQLVDRWQNRFAPLINKEGVATTDPTQIAFLLLSQASTLFHDQPQKARSLFRESASARVLPEHCFFLMNQRTRNAALTDSMFSDASHILLQRPVMEANELLVLSSYLFSPDNSINYVVISGYNAANAAGNVSAAPKNTALAKQYLSLLLAKLSPSESVPPEVAYFALKNLLPQYTTLAPDHLQDLYAKLGTWAPTVSGRSTSNYESAREGFTASETEATAGWEKRVQQADKIENAGRRDLEYFTIITGYLLPKKDFTRAVRLASRIDNPELEQTLVDFSYLKSIQFALTYPEASSPQLQADFTSIKNPLLKAVALSSAAHAQIDGKITGDALLLLDQASNEAKRIDSGQDRLQVQLMLAQLYLSADLPRGFGTAALVFKGINQHPEFSFRRSRLSVTASVYGLTNQLQLELPTPSSLISTVEKMCRVNCREAFETCRILERKDMRLWAMLEAVRTAVITNEKELKTVTIAPPAALKH